MKYNVTWRPPRLPNDYYHLRIESDAVTADLPITVPEAIATFNVIRDDDEYLPHSSRPWWVDAAHGRTVFNIETLEGLSSVWLRVPGDPLHGALEEIIEHATQQGGDAE